VRARGLAHATSRGQPTRTAPRRPGGNRPPRPLPGCRGPVRRRSAPRPGDPPVPPRTPVVSGLHDRIRDSAGARPRPCWAARCTASWPAQQAGRPRH